MRTIGRGIKTCTRPIEPSNLRAQLKNASISILDAYSTRNGLIDASARPIGVCDGPFFINHIATVEKWPDIIRKIFLQCFLTAENNTESSGVFACYVFAKLLLANCAQHMDLREISICSRYTDEKTITPTINRLLQRDSSLFFDVLDCIGTRGTININTGSKSRFTLEVFAGHHFNIGIDPGFCTHSLKRPSAQMFLIDGCIERVSEIHRLLDYCTENKTTCVIIARKFGDDVLSTLNFNFQRGTLDVIPLLVKDEITHLNTFVDLGTTTGGTVIESSSGLTTSQFDPHDMVSVSNIRCTLKDTSYSAVQVAQARVQIRIKKLQEKIDKLLCADSMQKTDIDILLRSRINSLSTNSATLWLPIESDKNGLYEFVSSRFKFGLGLIDSFCTTGAISTQEHCLHSIFDELGVAFLPADIVVNSIRVGNNFVKSIETIGGCLVIERPN